MTEFSFLSKLTLDGRISFFETATPLPLYPCFLLIYMFFIWNERSRKPQYRFLIQAASWMIVTLLIMQYPVKCRCDAHHLHSRCIQQPCRLWRHIKRLENLCEEHGFKRFPFVTVQKWRNAHSKMLLILQDRGLPEGQKSPSCLFCLGLDVTLKVLVYLGLLQKGWGAGGFCFDGALWLWRECACYYDHCVMYITKLWKLISDA